MSKDSPDYRDAPASLDAEQFRALGHRLVDRISDYFADSVDRAVDPPVANDTLSELLPQAALPDRGSEPDRLLDRAAQLLCEHTLQTAHPRHLAYIVGSASRLGVLADFLAAAVNTPVQSYPPFAMGVALEHQTIGWMAELLGYPAGCAGLFVSGGSMANFLGITAGVRARASWDVRAHGLTHPDAAKVRVYLTSEAHISVIRAVEICGLGVNAIHWIATDDQGRMDADELRSAIDSDRAAGLTPLLVAASAGTTSTGSVDPLRTIAALCREHKLWFHVDGAYGACAVISELAPDQLAGIRDADSLVIDPHKWMYLPMEVGCVLTRDRHALYEAFRRSADYYAWTPQYFPDGAEALPYRDQGMQTSRYLRALKVWLCLQHVGREGYQRMLTDDIALARRLYDQAAAAPTLEAVTHSLSVTTFRCRPSDLDPEKPADREYLDQINREVLVRLKASGQVYLSPTVVHGAFVLRICVVNYNTTRADIDALVELVIRLGQEVDAELRPSRA
ncbi:MAG: aminotransferase class I/II-fold pyridoxal phosphate-dependent enzyme [Haliangiales bacterium]